MASYRDHEAAQLRRQGRSYVEIADRLGYPDRRAAHRGVLRGLAERPADDALLRAVAVRRTDERLCELQRGLFVLLAQREPQSYDAGRGTRAYWRVFDSLFKVSVARCELYGLHTHPYRCDLWWRHDVPAVELLALRVMSARLEYETRIPVRDRAPKVTRQLAPVVPLHPVPVAPVLDVDELVPASVRRQLDGIVA